MTQDILHPGSMYELLVLGFAYDDGKPGREQGV